ncbi:thioredoxin fold domain-containing protein [Herminiimonas sp. KBW02]|uniref:thioredoxin family protein n=1 Tax=Herminiimonas sp. KBW02 TaxID=2153363 RepID=UPI001315044D|nr:thioredoxin fold domain-containing protein [Herminiimonas sp. KBW02]
MKSLFLCLLCLVLSTHAVADNKAAAIPMVSDLARDGAQAEREAKPVILFFSLPGCPFCHVVRNNYLYPLLRDSKPKERPVIREVDMASAQSVQSFDRSSTSPRGIAQKYKVIAAPTVIFVDASGCMLAPPIIGGDIAGVYGGYLDNAFDASAKKIAAAKKAGSGKKGAVQECAPP